MDFVSANIHSSVSGKVKKIDSIPDSSGYPKNGIVIDVEGDEWMEGIDQTGELVKNFDLTSEEIVAKIIGEWDCWIRRRQPSLTHVKIVPPKGMKAEVLLINGVECEPYLTSPTTG